MNSDSDSMMPLMMMMMTMGDNQNSNMMMPVLIMSMMNKVTLSSFNVKLKVSHLATPVLIEVVVEES